MEGKPGLVSLRVMGLGVGQLQLVKVRLLSCSTCMTISISGHYAPTVVSCGPPRMISNGFISSSTGTTLNETTIYACDSGYTLSRTGGGTFYSDYRYGDGSVITCQASGKWETPPVCLQRGTKKQLNFIRIYATCILFTGLYETLQQ